MQEIKNEIRDAMQYFQSYPNEKSYCVSTAEAYLKVLINSQTKQYRYYRIDTTESLGSGSFGVIFKCFRIDPSTNVEEPKPYAAKIFKNRSTFKPEEAEFLKQYYFAEPPVDDGTRIFLVQEFFPGEVLLNGGLSPSLQNLTFIESLELMYQICLRVNSLHHFTPSTGEIVYHGDIKGENIKVFRRDKIFDVYLYDFGLSKKLNHVNDLLRMDKGRGTPSYAAPEVFLGIYSVKTDIFALTALFLIILGVEEPFSYKENEQDDYWIMPFNFSLLLRRFEKDLVICPHPLKKLITDFLHRMESPSADLRPDSDELLRFITSLKNYYSLVQKNPDDIEPVNHYAVHLALLATNLWPVTQSLCAGSIELTKGQTDALLNAFKSNTLNILSLTSILQIRLPFFDLRKMLENQLSELKACYYPSFIYQTLAALIRFNSDSAAKTLQQIRTFTPRQHRDFRLIMEYFKLFAYVDVASIQMVAQNLDQMSALKVCLEYHSTKRLTEEQASTSRSWFWSRRISPKEELLITEKILNTIKRDRPISIETKDLVTPRELEALKGSTLLEILEVYQIIVKKSKQLEEIGLADLSVLLQDNQQVSLVS